jgi:Rad3-related DNA helicase
LRKSVDGVFAPKGSLSRVLDPFEWRPQQAEMAAAVADALERTDILVCEAPTGVGKSLAYLVPGAIWARAEGKVLMVSTHTRNLQDQILRRDLPLLRRLTDRKIEVAILKGRGNYLCRRRWETARDDLTGTTDGEAFVRALEAWVQLTESGDFDEAPPVPPRLRGLFSRIGSEARFCASGECAAEDGCFFKLSRRRAREAHVVLVNHALLVIELLHQAAGLPDADAIVIDEAHHLPRIAGDALAKRASARGFRRDLLGLGGQGEPGATDRIRRLVRGWPAAAERQRLLRRIREMEAELGELIAATDAFFADVRREPGYPPPGGRARYRLGAGSGGPFPASTYPLIESASRLLERHAALIDEITPRLDEEVRERILPEAEADVEAARAAVAVLTSLVEADEAGTVYWMEDDANEGPTFHARPLDLSSTLGSRLASGRPLILTSATLAADGRTEFFSRQCGLPADARSLILPPVFDLERQVRVLVPESIHDPTEAGHTGDLGDGILKLASGISRKILVLFTAHETLRRVEERIREPLEARGIHLYAQGQQTRQALTEAFLSSPRAVLLGAASFWEGVDFPGEDLELLVMVRLPFPVPNDPFVEAYSERLREEGFDPFETYMLPEAIVRFRQGFGRLIRRRDDRGVFAVLDPRILRRGYGARFRGALGSPTRAVSSWDALIHEAEEHFRV